MKSKTLEIIEKNYMNIKREEYPYGSFDVFIDYFGGMFEIELVGGWNVEEQVPEYLFGTGLGKEYYYAGFDQALSVALKDIRESNEDLEVKNEAESALARACVEFHLKHKGML